MISKKVNGQIKSSKVMVIGNDGSQIGTLPTQIAISKARNQGYDLVEVSAKSNPPICKIMDYGKFLFEQKKQDRKNKAKSKVHLKEIRMKTRIADHDLTTKVKRCLEFLSKGDKVKVSIQVNKRLRNDSSKAYELIDRISEVVGEMGILTNTPKLSGRYLDAMFIAKNN